MYKEELALNNLQWLVCQKRRPNNIYACIYKHTYTYNMLQYVYICVCAWRRHRTYSNLMTKPLWRQLFSEKLTLNRRLEKEAPASNLCWLVGILWVEMTKRSYSEVKHPIWIVTSYLAMPFTGLSLCRQAETGIPIFQVYVIILA